MSTQTQTQTQSSFRNIVLTHECYRPSIAWPTVCLAFVSLSMWLASAYAAIVLGWQMSSTVPVSSLAVYMIFTPFHDAIHRAVSKDYRWLNELIGWISCVPFLIFPFPAYRFLHLRHHKYTNDPVLDPDYKSSNIPLFATLLGWIKCLCQFGHLMSSADILQSSVFVGCNLTILAMCFYSGGGRLVVQCLLLPFAFGIMFLSIFFAILPHRHGTIRAEDHYGSTHTLDGLFNVADGDSSFWLTCLLLGQNFHSVHHVYPMIPFYKYAAVWRKNKAQFLGAGVKLQSMIHKPRRHSNK